MDFHKVQVVTQSEAKATHQDCLLPIQVDYKTTSFYVNLMNFHSSLFYTLRCLDFYPYGVGLLVGLRITLWVSLAVLGAGRVETDTYPDDGTFPEGA